MPLFKNDFDCKSTLLNVVMIFFNVKKSHCLFDILNQL